MGNYRFRLSDMIPNAWFYKLRDMSKTRSSQNPNYSHKKLPPFPPSQKPTKSSPNSSSTTTKNLTLKSFDHTHSYNPPRKSFKKWAKRRTVYVPSPKKITPAASACNMFHDPDDDFPTSNLDQGFQDTDHHDSFHGPSCNNQAFWSIPGACKLTSSTTDIIIDVVDKPLSKEPDFTIISEPKLPPIQTRPRPPKPILENQDRLPSKETRTPGAATASCRKSVSRRSTGGVRISRARVAGKKAEGRARKSVKGERKEMYNAERVAIVKSSLDPERDFRESMMEMIEENNIRASNSKEMEELLACYLSLNSNHYHHIIIKAFQQIWLDFPQQALN